MKIDLVSVWDLDETSGTDVFDEHSSNDGVRTASILQNITTVTNITPGYQGAGSSSERVDIPTFNFLSGDFSVSLWTNASGSSTARGFFNKRQVLSPNVGFVIIYDSDGFANLVIDEGATATNIAGTSSIDGGQHHIVATRDGGTITLYVNNVNENSDTGLTTDLDNSNELKFFNNRINTAIYDGTLDQVAIWTKALSTEEISALYNSGNGLNYTNW
ncbi:MAG: LamG domain-containing protein [Candidatus Peribacteraceae bacterium]|nr:LamG domain-containing protein [Candidatus Peribacteraceae bacterium]